MKRTGTNPLEPSAGGNTAAALVLAVALGLPAGASADEADARRLLKAMSDYVAAQDNLSFAFDATLEVVTSDDQKLSLASSGAVTLNRPDKIHMTRSGGFADVEVAFNGKTLTLFGKTMNRYTQIEAPGTVDQLVEELRVTHNRPLPAADLLVSDSYDALMEDVVDAKDLGSGVIGGVECYYLAFRKEDVDLQIWIAQGERPYPCRYVITSKTMATSPQYTIQIRDWKTGSEASSANFDFANSTDAEKIDLADLHDSNELPRHFVIGGAQ